MPIEIKTKSQTNGPTEKVTFTITCFGQGNKQRCERVINVNNLANVEFSYIQTEDLMHLAIQVRVQHAPKNCYVNAKISYNAYKSYSDHIHLNNEVSWKVPGDKLYHLNKYEEAYLFQFSLTLHACKVESILDKLYNDTEFTDFRLSTDEGSVNIHKASLAAQSDVFKAMLNKEWTEAKEGRVQMKGVSLQTLRELKKYMYLGTLPDDVLPLLSIATFYLMENLKTECLWKVGQNITPQNFYNMLEYSIVNNMPELTFAILKATSEDVLRNAERHFDIEKKYKEEPEDE